jgi:ABC-type transport system substrate-binding protein/DNA-binding SARP family transcriptional activator/streptogramin lyase
MASALQLKVFLAGRVAVEADGVRMGEERLAGRQGRILFAYLVAEQGRPVPRDELAQALWGKAPPATWEKALTVLVSKLRGLLAECGLDGAKVLASAFGSYRLDLPEGAWVDVIAAADLLHEAQAALAADDLEQAKAVAMRAASLARPSFLPGEEGAWVDSKRRELTEVLRRALGCVAEACLRSGDEAGAAKWAEETIALDPYRESGYRRLMAAHAAAGNRAEALRVYERCRQLLATELGTYPSPETESIYRELLRAPAPEPSASAPDGSPVPVLEREPETMPSFGSRRLAVVAAAAAAIAAAVVVPLVVLGGASQRAVSANSIVALGPSGSIADTILVGARPVAIISGVGALWVANLDDQTVTRVDPSSRRVVRNIPLGDAPTALAATRTAVWVTDGTGRVSKIDPRYDRLTSTQSLAASGSFFRGTVRPTLAAFGSIWIVHPDGYISRIDAQSGRRTGSAGVGNAPSAIAAGAGSIWVTNSADGTFTRIDPTTLVARTFPVGHGPAAVAVNAAGAWIANSGDNQLVRVDTGTNAVVGTTRVGDGPTAVLATPTALWVANGRDGTVMRLDPRSGKEAKTISLGGTPNAFASAGGQVWVALAPAPPRPPAAGGVARLAVPDDFESLDPARLQDVVAGQLSFATCANLVTYPDKPAPEGSRIVPEVAEAVPAPTAGGKTYTFTIRPGFRFSPPSHEAATATTFKSTIERVTNPRMKSPHASVFSGIVGYQAYVTRKAREISGIVARGRTLTIRLAQPDGAFLVNLAAGSACAVPRDTPADPDGINDIPSAGPYYIASYTPRQQLVLRRNPNYHGERPHRLDQIVVAIGVDRSRTLEQIEAGKADYALGGLPREVGPRLESAYGPGSKAAKAGHQRYFISAALGARWLHMNTSRPLFSHVRLRQAVNYAIDRRSLAAQGRRFGLGTFDGGAPTDDYVPPTIPGATDFHLYPVNGPDLRRAKRIAGRVHATAILYAVNLPLWQQEAQIIRRDLKPLGIDVQVKEFSIGDFFTRIGRRGEPFDLAVSGWAFLADPGSVLGIFGGSANGNLSHFNDAAFDRKLTAAARLSGAKRYRAYSRLALELERDWAPAAAITTTTSRDFFSARIGCQVYQPFYGMDIAALCLRR